MPFRENVSQTSVESLQKMQEVFLMDTLMKEEEENKRQIEMERERDLERERALETPRDALHVGVLDYAFMCVSLILL